MLRFLFCKYIFQYTFPQCFPHIIFSKGCCHCKGGNKCHFYGNERKAVDGLPQLFFKPDENEE